MARQHGEPEPEAEAMERGLAAARAQQFYEDCSISLDQLPLAELFAPHLLTSRAHRAATAGMVDGSGQQPLCDRRHPS